MCAPIMIEKNTIRPYETAGIGKRPAADGFLENSLSGVPKVQVGRRISQAKGQKGGFPFSEKPFQAVRLFL